MAAPITHIVLANELYRKYFSDKEKRAFYVGTSLPDIRYLGVIERDKTHCRNISLVDLLEKDSFNAGLLFHSLVDKTRQQFMEKNSYCSLFPKTGVFVRALKVFEDRILYNKINNWPKIISCFNKVYKPELDLGIKSCDIKRWHQLLKNYFARKPEDKDSIAFTTGIGLSLETAQETVNAIKMLDAKKAKKTVIDFYNKFEELT
ncbi:MAG: hypothetical protein ABIB61_01110 [Candidatus Shapirobacteria bacterium]